MTEESTVGPAPELNPQARDAAEKAAALTNLQRADRKFNQLMKPHLERMLQAVSYVAAESGQHPVFGLMMVGVDLVAANFAGYTTGMDGSQVDELRKLVHDKIDRMIEFSRREMARLKNAIEKSLAEGRAEAEAQEGPDQ